MPAVQVLASSPLSGKTAIAIAIAQGMARSGTRVRLARLGQGEAAEADARSFASYLFASSSGLPTAEPPQASAGETLIIELDAGATPLAGVQALIVVRGGPQEADRALAAQLGERLAGTIAVAIEPGQIGNVGRELTDGNMRPLAVVPEDRALMAPSVAELGANLRARVLYQGENDEEVVEDVLIAPVYADPARPHFRRFKSMAILAPFNKTDLHLAAIESQAACLILTGGKEPSPYVIDRAQHEPVTIFLSAQDTSGTVAALADVWSSTRFRGDFKAQAALAALDGRVDFAGLARKLAG